VRAAADVLADGGNAFDAAVAGLWMACVCEPVLASPGGGGFVMAKPGGSDAAAVYDFFAQTPRTRRPPGGLDFHAIHADFGPATQEFHIGRGASATPGFVPGLYAVHAALGRLAMPRLLAPAIAAARDGVRVTALQAFLFQVVRPIFLATGPARAVFAPEGRLPRQGELFANRGLSDFLDALACGGLGFYAAEGAAAMLAGQPAEGHLRKADIAAYRVMRRDSLSLDHAGARIHLNPPPSRGGAFVAHALKGCGASDPGAMAAALARADAARRACGGDAAALLGAAGLAAPHVPAGGVASRGTTHVSAIDAQGNAASATVSNGEGNGHVTPGFGFMLNNMLGEEDLNPGGFHTWREAARLASNMCPVVAQTADGGLVALGSGGSNRIRSAVFQTLLRILDSDCGPAEAVAAPRLHMEDGRLDFEDRFDDATGAALRSAFPEHRAWSDDNLFFGGVHAVCRRPDGTFQAAGDRRRGGHAMVVE
jgi:gamma-glutamyltranspeptidase/glutathione hydrolase